ncbi:MAG: ADP-ribosylglycohydrolase family protein [Deltaproteobacteria bacterium]|nr:ADP-ribosylglycohydrolase family protein [Deltaproteobacteria bacterium]
MLAISSADTLRRLDPTFLLLGGASAGLLASRAFAHARKQRRSYEDLPFGGWPIAPSSDAFVERARGALVGAAVGDALGFFRENLPPAFAKLRFGSKPAHHAGRIRFMRKPGSISDDTQLTVLVARAIANDGSVSVETFEKSLGEWLPRAIGAGRATLRAARALAKGQHAPDPKSLGNGAAMRVAPLAVAFGATPKLLDAVRTISAVTHEHPEAIAGAELVALFFSRALLRLDLDMDAIDRAIHETSTKDAPRWRSTLAAAHASAISTGDLGKTSGLVFDTLAAALHLFTRFPKDPARGLELLFTKGGDVDTIAAIYAGLVGAKETLAVFDPALVAPVQGLRILVREADRLATARKRNRS